MFAIIFKFIILFVFYTQLEARYGCPGVSLSSKCGCNCACTSAWYSAEYTYKTIVRCDGYGGTITGFRDLFSKTLKGYEIDDLIINNYRQTRLPDEALSDIVVNRVFILNSPFLENFGYSGTGKTFFSGSENYLQTLILSNTPVIRAEEWPLLTKSLTATQVEPVLKNLIIFYNAVTTITTLSDFNGLVNLEKIIMRLTGLNTLGDTLDLTQFPNLKFLDLSQNTLTKFNAKLPPSLTTIYLNSNILDRFDPTLFEQLNTVDYINLNNPNNLDCSCDAIRPIVGTELADKFDGICSQPYQVAGKKYGYACFTPPDQIIEGYSKKQSTKFIRRKYD